MSLVTTKTPKQGHTASTKLHHLVLTCLISRSYAGAFCCPTASRGRHPRCGATHKPPHLGLPSSGLISGSGFSLCSGHIWLTVGFFSLISWLMCASQMFPSHTLFGHLLCVCWTISLILPCMFYCYLCMWHHCCCSAWFCPWGALVAVVVLYPVLLACLYDNTNSFLNQSWANNWHTGSRKWPLEASLSTQKHWGWTLQRRTLYTVLWLEMKAHLIFILHYFKEGKAAQRWFQRGRFRQALQASFMYSLTHKEVLNCGFNAVSDSVLLLFFLLAFSFFASANPRPTPHPTHLLSCLPIWFKSIILSSFPGFILHHAPQGQGAAQRHQLPHHASLHRRASRHASYSYFSSLRLSITISCLFTFIITRHFLNSSMADWLSYLMAQDWDLRSGITAAGPHELIFGEATDSIGTQTIGWKHESHRIWDL